MPSLRVLGRRHRIKWILLVVGLTAFLTFATSGFDELGFFDLSTLKSSDRDGAWSSHPVVLLHKRAQEQFESLLRRQSRNADQAEAKYLARYGRRAPPGFKQWVDYALTHASPIIDEFDTLTRPVHRYLNLTAAEIAQRVRDATAAGDHNGRVEKCEFARGRFSSGCRHFAAPLTALLRDAGKLVPDVDFLLNFLDEPSVLVTKAGAQQPGSVGWKDSSHKSNAPAIAEACMLRGNLTLNSGTSDGIDTHSIPFVVEEAAAAKDLCRHPEYSSGHGFLMSPASFMQMQSDIPILSQAVPYPFSDIPYPSTHYSLRSSLYTQWHDRIWQRKKNAVYWTGASTGGEWTLENWRQGHRQRLAKLGGQKEDRLITYLQQSGNNLGSVEPYISSIFPNSLFDVHLTKIVGCADASVCEEQNGLFGTPRKPDHDGRPFAYRYVLDIDGNSYSGRFYRFLASRSVPLKISIFSEWHDDRLVPWLHYVPVSQSMEELPELMRFLATTGEGQRISRRIAEAGRDWYFKAIAPVHQGIYLYRLLLELAWMQNESRPVD